MIKISPDTRLKLTLGILLVLVTFWLGYRFGPGCPLPEPHGRPAAPAARHS